MLTKIPDQLLKNKKFFSVWIGYNKNVQRRVYSPNELEYLFRPKSIGIIGATERKGSVGNSIVENLLKGENNYKLYFINAKGKKIYNRDSYTSISEVNGDIDLVVIVVPAKSVLNVMKELKTKNVKGVVIITAGFKETGKEGLKLEQEIINIAKMNNIRIIGPNCLGIINVYHQMNASFAGNKISKGPFSLLSQSGAICSAALDLARQYNIGFSHFISVGSMCDVEFYELVEYLFYDKNTKYILIYMETVGDINKFAGICKTVCLYKPIILLKSGKTTKAAQAAVSHTGSMVGNYDIFYAYMKKIGVLVADNFEELIDMCKVLNSFKYPQTNDFCVVTNAGGPGVLMVDDIIKHKGNLSDLNESLKNKLNEFLPQSWSKSNPIDILGDASPLLYQKTIECILKDKQYKNVAVLLSPQTVTDPINTAKEIIKMKKEIQEKEKIVLCNYLGGEDLKVATEMLNKNDIPTFVHLEQAAKNLLKLYANAMHIQSIYEEIPDTLSDSTQNYYLQSIIDNYYEMRQIQKKNNNEKINTLTNNSNNNNNNNNNNSNNTNEIEVENENEKDKECNNNNNKEHNHNHNQKDVDIENNTIDKVLLKRNRKKRSVEIIKKAIDKNHSILSEYDSKQILQNYDLPVIDTKVFKDVEEIKKWKHFSFPCAMKINSDTITHKKDVGGVILNIMNKEQLINAYNEIYENVKHYKLEKEFNGVTIQKMINTSDGIELILGYYYDANFGPVILFGAGGSYVEIFKDTVLLIPPLNFSYTHHTIKNTKIYEALIGKSSRFKKSDMSKLILTIINFSELVLDLLPYIKESDINPLFISGDYTVALDARFSLNKVPEFNAKLNYDICSKKYPLDFIFFNHLNKNKKEHALENDVSHISERKNDDDITIKNNTSTHSEEMKTVTRCIHPYDFKLIYKFLKNTYEQLHSDAFFFTDPNHINTKLFAYELCNYDYDLCKVILHTVNNEIKGLLKIQKRKNINNCYIYAQEESVFHILMDTLNILTKEEKVQTNFMYLKDGSPYIFAIQQWNYNLNHVQGNVRAYVCHY